MFDTRFPGLMYTCDSDRVWRIVDVRSGGFDLTTGFGGRVGPIYRTRAELLADLERFAAEFGDPASTSVPTDKRNRDLQERLDSLLEEIDSLADFVADSTDLRIGETNILQRLNDMATPEAATL
jgi:hypothetical protein